MKKAVFTIQMYILVAVFPVYLVAALNKKTGIPPVDNTPGEFKEKAERSDLQPALNPGYKGMSSCVGGTNAYYFNQ